MIFDLAADLRIAALGDDGKITRRSCRDVDVEIHRECSGIEGGAEVCGGSRQGKPESRGCRRHVYLKDQERGRNSLATDDRRRSYGACSNVLITASSVASS